ncbi:MAG TPA: efflux RND transporter periplasmic adaptor subunit [Dongiaceae bacterium]|nr:efflux RND transporter periplasmic adaptor subunit [Dongiaceae bacterium]
MTKKTIAIGAIALVLIAFTIGRYSRPAATSEHFSQRRILYYVDPMHPSYRSDKPGTAPDCGMALEPVYEGEQSASATPLPAGAVSISSDRQQLYGIRVDTISKHSGPHIVRTTGRVQAEDNRVFRLMAATEGWVQSLQNTPVGTVVKKNELLGTFYSKEFRNAEQAYLTSLTTLDRLKPGHNLDEAVKGNDANIRINEEQLRSLGMSEPQIRELAKSRETTRDITINSPVDGVVLTRDISPLQKFESGAEFYRIADLNKVWILADVFGDEGEIYRPGAKVRVSLRETGKTVSAVVDNQAPVFDPTTHVFKLRLEADNPGYLLRPDMFVDLEFNVTSPAGILVPQEAILDTGMGKTVYVEAAEGVFVAHAVKVGATLGSMVAITSGLSAGDRYVASGSFLVDSESRLRGTPLVAAQMTKNAEMSAPAKDPVCGMPLNDAQARSTQHEETYHGEKFHFCSDNCQNKFRKDPARYTGPNAAASNTTPDTRSEARR